jgi:hypothetical protein
MASQYFSTLSGNFLLGDENTGSLRQTKALAKIGRKMP